jgi:prepilin-type N-terminal cleavage/methylation domain-containing protein
MKLPKTRPNAFTLIELLVVIAIIAILASLAVPAITGALEKGQMTQTVSNGRSIALAAADMALENSKNQDPFQGWPGDLFERQGQGKINGAKDYLQRLTEYTSTKIGDIKKLTAAPGIQPFDGETMDTFNPDRNCAFKIFKVTENDGGDTVFLTTKNYTYNESLSPTTSQYKDKGFVVTQKLGSSSAYKKQEVKAILRIGLLPGRKDTQDRPQESQDDYLGNQ